MQDTVIYRSAMHWRTPSNLLVGVFLCAIGFPTLCWVVMGIPEIIQNPKYAVAGIIPLLVGGTLSWAGIACLRGYARRSTFELIVTDAGVRYGERTYPWDDIGSLSARRYRRKIQLLLHRRGRVALDRHLHSDHGISESEFRDLIQTLRLRISPKFPHVRFG